VRLSQDLLAVMEAQLNPSEELAAGAVSALPVEDPALVQWQPMLRIVFGVSAIFAIFVFVLPPLSLVVPAIALALYAARFRAARITAGLGARIGLLSGLIMTTLLSLMSAASSLFLRLRTHEMAGFDAALAAQFQQFRDRLTAQNVPDVAASTAFLNIPEFRAGVMIGGFAMAAVAFLAVTTISGALAGLARSRGTVRPGL
jgi:hypothetical protein